ncbi:MULTISPECIES: hypothetical protein [Cyanophyceae]|uniref:hypothetical protein n=1 Tax=Cyanophyceae TaxID=3028117 RepID=UPI0016849242|nr:hypothetical protein [Trichocoleus sp. FACHB-69]MBD1930698.1 hypothetical protein [Trichocoleus sp. FACHB-69]
MASDAQAQNRRSSGVASLGEMGCRRIGGMGGYNPVNEDVSIGREIFRAVAYLGNSDFGQNAWGIYKDRPTEVACRLAAVNARPQFKTLTLSFGFSQTSDLLDGSVIVRLSVYKDGNFYGEQTISKGDKIRWPIDVTNTRTLALETQCVRAKQGRNSCPNIWLIEDILRK